MLEEGVGDHRHQRVAMQALPRATLEVVEAEFLFELLMRLLAHPARLDGRGERFQIGVGREVHEIVFLFPRGAALADQPGLFARHVLHAFVADALRLSVGDAHAQSGEAGFQQAFGSLAPSDYAPFFIGEHLLCALGENVGHTAFARSAASGDRKDEFDVARIDFLMTRNADRPRQRSPAQRPAELCAHAVAGVGEDRAKTNPDADQPIEFGEPISDFDRVER